MKYALLLTLAACGMPPVAGTWEALNVNVEGGTLDITQDFTDKTLSTKAVSYVGSTAYFTTIFSGTYVWENKSDGTHVLTSYSSASITGPQGPVTPLETVCTAKANCEGYQFKADSASDKTICLCKRQELVFKVNGDTMTGLYEGTTVTYRHPQG